MAGGDGRPPSREAREEHLARLVAEIAKVDDVLLLADVKTALGRRMNQLWPHGFRAWLAQYPTHFLEEALRFGDDTSFPLLPTPRDMEQLYENFRAEIWDIAIAQARQAGYTGMIDVDGTQVEAALLIRYLTVNAPARLRGKMLKSDHEFARALLWVAVSTVAREILAEREAATEAHG